jgi:hypothetical protein
VNVNKGEQVEVAPQRGKKLNGGFDSPHAPKKKVEKPLDKRSQVWYNKDVSKRENKFPC